MIKKLTMCLLAALLTVLLLVPPMPVSAAGAYTVRLADASGNNVVTAKPGEQVTLTLSIENNPGIICVGVQMRYPEGLSLSQRPQNVSALDAVADGQRIFSPSLSNNPYLMWWNYALGDYNQKLIYTNGNLAQITFSVAANAAAGDYVITLSTPSDKNTTAGVDGSGVIQPDTNRPVTGITVVGCTIRVEGASTAKPSTPETTQPKPSAPVTTKPTDPTKATEATQPSAGTDATAETTQPTVGTDGTTETTAALTEPETAPEASEETAAAGKREPITLKDTPGAIRILFALGIVLLIGGILFVTLRRKPNDYQD